MSEKNGTARGIDPAGVEESARGTVYLLHLDEPFWSPGRTYRWMHYIGHARQGYLVARLEAHAAGRGAKFTRLAREAGCTWHLARTWPGSYDQERKIKRKGGASRFCPSCGVIPSAERQQYRGADGRYIVPPGKKAWARLEVTRCEARLDGRTLARLVYDGPVITVVRDGTPAGRVMPDGEGSFSAWTAPHPAAPTPSDRLLASAVPLRNAVARVLGLASC